ncbi:MAG: YfiT family bacillithiol transferase [Cyclobacteriaceae bacterium]
MELEELKYPKGKYQTPDVIDQAVISEWMDTLQQLPVNLRKLVENLSYECLDWVYRPKGWTIKQVVHHLADSHMNSFVRFKLMMTEDNPTICPYEESKWAKMPDGNNPEISTSLMILDGLHGRLNVLLRDLISDDWNRTFYHPEYEKSLTLSWMIGLYAWHSNHHLAHIQQAIDQEGNFELKE